MPTRPWMRSCRGRSEFFSFTTSHRLGFWAWILPMNPEPTQMLCGFRIGSRPAAAGWAAGGGGANPPRAGAHERQKGSAFDAGCHRLLLSGARGGAGGWRKDQFGGEFAALSLRLNGLAALFHAPARQGESPAGGVETFSP